MKISAPTTEQGNLVFDPKAVAQADAIAVLVPGAFCKLSMFDQADRWRDHGFALVKYRFPGLDGRPLHPALRIGKAASEIAAFLAPFKEKKVYLLGYSTGLPIALSAAALVDRPVRIAGMSPAVECGGGVETTARTIRLLAKAAARARSLRLRTVWLAYYQALLFGERVWTDAALSARALEIIAARRDKIVFPEGGRPKAHTSDLRRWDLPNGARFKPGQVRFFWGAEDPVFSRAQIEHFAARVGPADVTVYPGHGHLLFATQSVVFHDIFAFFEGD